MVGYPCSSRWPPPEALVLRAIIQRVKTPFERSYWVVPGKFIAGCYPGDRDPELAAAKLEGMVGAGIRHVVNLMEETEFGHQGVPFVPYQPTFAARGINCVRMPIKDQHTPSRQEMVAILDDIDRAIAAGATTYVHCWGARAAPAPPSAAGWCVTAWSHRTGQKRTSKTCKLFATANCSRRLRTTSSADSCRAGHRGNNHANAAGPPRGGRLGAPGGRRVGRAL